MKHLSPLAQGYIYGLIGVVIFGLTLPTTSIAVAEFPPIMVGLGRSIVAAALAGLFLFASKARRPSKAELKRLALVPIGVVFGFPALTAFAMQTAPAAHGGVVLGILPLATAIAAMLVAHERPSPIFWLWGFVGAAAVITFALLDGGTEIFGADLLLLAAVCLAAFGYAQSGVLARSMNGLEVISWALVISLPILIVIVALNIDHINWSASWQAWASFAYVAIFSQFLGFAFWNKGLALGGISHVGQTQLFQIFVTLIGSAILLGETIHSSTILFALIVVFAVAMGKRAPVLRDVSERKDTPRRSAAND